MKTTVELRKQYDALFNNNVTATRVGRIKENEASKGPMR